MAKNKKKAEPELTLYEKAGMYEVISEVETETEITAVLRTYSGTTVTCHIPKHTPEEQKRINSNLCLAMFKMCYPDKDFSGMELQVIA